MKIEVITSFHEPYFNLIGKDCVNTWVKFWPRNLYLTCYVEGFEMPPFKRVRPISFGELPKEYFEFQEKEASGNVKKFAKKAFSFIHAMHNSDADRIIWLDADVITQKNMPLEFLESLLPDSVLSTQMGVTYHTKKTGELGNWYVPETGFFAVNTRHELFLKFRETYTDMYVNWKFENLRRWYDNDVFGYTLKSLDAPTLDLCANFIKAYKTPLRHTVLGEYLQHHKAKHSKDQYSKI